MSTTPVRRVLSMDKRELKVRVTTPVLGEEQELTVTTIYRDPGCYIGLSAYHIGTSEHLRGVGMTLPWGNALDVAKHIIKLAKDAGVDVGDELT